MALRTGTSDVMWRWQGTKECCWLTCIEMLMYTKYRNIYGENRIAHPDFAMEEYRKNKGSRLELHAEDYGLVTNDTLVSSHEQRDWEVALERGPVIAAGKYGAGKLGWGEHAILIIGVSRTGNLVYYNPNVFSFLTSKSDRRSYMSIRRCQQLATRTGLGGPFWQVRADAARSGQIFSEVDVSAQSFKVGTVRRGFASDFY
ncbi:papain-like cysteine protease family protein [Massilia sp. CFBP9012]|uniref:papain-like cysteine protease family protein n=1 Tax=Massilia sp. CFBP9012 TaxID=3096531 RepID=UPI002A6B8771|nr:papain-like cysteine protease family protein [Massilia sp. CFBP9012]MDY0977796.1 papain-like cysteine protease family protein [Massilia sp. CFBP9012]